MLFACIYISSQDVSDENLENLHRKGLLRDAYAMLCHSVRSRTPFRVFPEPSSEVVWFARYFFI